MIGSTLAHYRIESKIGQGGMGEVWRATDSKLGRPVALKLLPEAFARDAERMARFQREAQLLASLNHPNIGAIYGLEHDSGRHALVLELVDGPTLVDRIREGPVPPAEALEIARQIADALQAAHERGIIHRDLKPDNVKLTADGQVKVLDFGLAKAMDDAPSSSSGSGEFTQSPTISPALSAMTGANVILGTAGYMSPEQARGHAADKRSDIWAFGVILFEMLTGRRLFAGETVSDSLAAVLKTEPDWDLLPPRTPAAARRLLHRCLEKKAKLRLHDIADARLEIDEAIAAPEETAGDHDARVAAAEEAAAAATAAAATARRTGRRIAALGVAIAAAAVLLSLWAPWRGVPEHATARAPVIRFSIPMNVADDVEPSFEGYYLDTPLLDISRDGTRIVWAYPRGDSVQLVLRSLDSEEQTVLPTQYATTPFFEPGGTRIGFLQAAHMLFIRPGDRSPTELTDMGYPRGAYWDEDGTIVFTPNTDDGLVRLDPRTGATDTLTTLEEGGEIRSHRWPSPLPGGRGILYTASSENILSFDEAEVRVLDLRTGESKDLVNGSMARYSPTGHLLWARDGLLYAAPFDLERLEITGEPVPVVRDLATRPNSGSAQYALSDDGTLVYLAGPPSQDSATLFWVDREGNAAPIDLPHVAYQNGSASPDGRKIVLEVDNANSNIWIADLDRGDLSRISLKGNNNDPVWAPDGRSVFYSGSRGGRRCIYRQQLDARSDAERLTPLEMPVDRPWVSPDGRTLVFNTTDPWDIMMRRLDGDDETIRPLVATEADAWDPAISPDGKWLAYFARETDRADVYVCPFPEGDGRWKVSTGGAQRCAWSPDGRLNWISDDGDMMEATITAEPEVRIGRPRKLFAAGDYDPLQIDEAPDGRFLLIHQEPCPWQPDRVQVVVNWFEELNRLVPR